MATSLKPLTLTICKKNPTGLIVLSLMKHIDQLIMKSIILKAHKAFFSINLSIDGMVLSVVSCNTKETFYSVAKFSEWAIAMNQITFFKGKQNIQRGKTSEQTSLG